MSRMSRTASTALMIMVGCGWLASACGRSPIGTKTDARIDGGTGGATTGGGGGSGGGGGTTPADGSIDRGPDAITPADAPVDRPDGAADLRDGPPDADRPDLVTERPPPMDMNPCSVDCTNLPHVRLGVVATCRGGECARVS